MRSITRPLLASILVIVALGTSTRAPQPAPSPESGFPTQEGDAPVASLSLQTRELGLPTPNSQGGEAFQVKNEIPATAFLPVQSKDAKELRAGKLLVASRNLGDPNFAETVVLLVHYDAEGAVGLILNRRTGVPLSRVLEGLKGAKDRSDRVYLGGPVETSAVFALLQSAEKLEGAEHIFGGVYLISTKTLFEQMMSARPDPGGFHVYLGYAGWSNEQLRKELELGAWFIFQADAGTVFNSDPDSLWSQMIRKTELKLAAEPADADQWTVMRDNTLPSEGALRRGLWEP